MEFYNEVFYFAFIKHFVVVDRMQIVSNLKYKMNVNLINIRLLLCSSGCLL